MASPSGIGPSREYRNIVHTRSFQGPGSILALCVLFVGAQVAADLRIPRHTRALHNKSSRSAAQQ